jgi:hypothetical protein
MVPGTDVAVAKAAVRSMTGVSVMLGSAVGEASARTGVNVGVGGTAVGDGCAVSVCAWAVCIAAFTVPAVSTFGAGFVGLVGRES